MKDVKDAKRWVTLLATLLAVLALVVTACGGGDEEAAPTSPPAPPTPTAAPQPTATPVPPTATTAPRPAATPTPQLLPTPTPTPAGAQVKTGGELRNRDIFEWGNWDTHSALGSFTVHLMQNVLNGLIQTDPFETSKFLPELAERWQVAGDGKTTTFFLRRGVKWQDGKDFTAADVVWNLDRSRKGTGGATYNVVRLSSIAGMEAVDNFTVRIDHSRVSASFMPNMATPFMQLYPPHGPVPGSVDFKSKGFGTGAFKIASWQANTQYRFVRNEGYWNKDENGRALPYLDGFTTFVIGDRTSALAAFRTQRIDCGCFYDQDILTEPKEQLEREMPGVKLALRSASRNLLYFNQRGPFANRDVRRAALMGVDLLTARNLWRGGKAFYPPSYWAVSELGGGWSLTSQELLQTPGFRVKDNKKDPADVTAAKDLFAKAGVDPKTITLELRVSSFYSDLAESLSTLVAANNGLNVKLSINPGGAAGSELFRQGQFDIFDVSGFALDDPSDLIPSYILKGGVNNVGKWEIADLERLYAQIETELDPAKRKDLTLQFQRKMLEEAIIWPSVYQAMSWGTQRYVNGNVAGNINVSARLKLERIWIDPSLK